MRSEDVCGAWVRVHEEDSDEGLVLRSADSPLPPARGRMAVELRPDGGYAERGLGASDVPEDAAGTWRLQGDTLTLSEGAAQGLPRVMRVVSAEPDRLVVRPA